MNSIAIISDIHGNYPAFRSVLEDIESRNIKMIYCLGDLVGYYCQINEVIDEIRTRSIKSIMGNHDFALVKRNGEIPTSKTCTRILKQQLNYISSDNYNYLTNLDSSLSFEFNELNYYCVHGGLIDQTDEYLWEIDQDYFRKNKFGRDILVSGHTHFPAIKNFVSNTYLNPGSVGQPRDGDKRASYLILSRTEKFQIVRVSYNIDEITDMMKQMNYESYIYEGLYLGKKIGS